MALKKYNVTVNKMATVLKLDERGAKRYGLTDKDLVGAKTSPAPAAKPEEKKAAPAPANKSRAAAANK
ncbi:hypothetical protein PBI_KEPLER_8 [Arthrobacter phage Kepler]|uniref:Uncharacterized protein n=7 Tax=Coralvirus TaxID=2733171 RepID=A0A5J6TSN9_9CAUD|nr:hypothetical protein HOU55_gp08 [Arthrobacter phage Kepler]AYN57583.1 hypothetical protein PBI_COTE_9 [Arthrobacter phage Cote]AYN57658.1 hypothetical protein PBI_DAOB_9 [Arthrobacter phage Daob]AYN58417.1 hypothetical protein PBI_LUNAR_9 [Arthrobacter phage Lunar]AYN58559.1 hypothetical protein PBI_MELONS_9 [Arthrobacter phage Melons]AYN58765.1 hypothetical protein PBI_POLKA_8 [Arthrobacter phage Polka]QFG13064.1 hypothetical protein PBI_AMELIA_9 [Arthrobacter phage Amelia]